MQVTNGIAKVNDVITVSCTMFKGRKYESKPARVSVELVSSNRKRFGNRHTLCYLIC